MKSRARKKEKEIAQMHTMSKYYENTIILCSQGVQIDLNTKL
jgi:hypothetical protein